MKPAIPGLVADLSAMLKKVYQEGMVLQEAWQQQFPLPSPGPPPPPPTAEELRAAHERTLREQIAKAIAPWLMTEDEYHDRRREEDDW